MKRYLTILLICLFPFLAFAAVDTFDGQTGIDTWDGQIGVDTIDGQVIVSGGATCDSCTGTLALSWHVEGANSTAALDVTNGTPPSCGCSNGDETATLHSDAVIANAPAGKSGYALHILGAWDGAEFDVSLEDIFDDTIGTLSFDLYITTWADNAHLYYAEGQGNEDFLRIKMSGTDEISLKYEGSNAGEVGATTVGANLTTATWYSITAKWRTGATDPSLYIEANSVSASSNTDLTVMDTDPTVIQWGRNGTAVFYLKNMKYTKEWL